jgi:hypothetical protein
MVKSILDTRFSDPDFSEPLQEAMNDTNLIFTANSLLDIGFRSSVEVESAVERAKAVCLNSGLRVGEHFKTIFVSDDDHHTVLRDWRLSRLAYTLCILNGSSDNPLVARLQITILDTYLQKTKS